MIAHSDLIKCDLMCLISAIQLSVQKCDCECDVRCADVQSVQSVQIARIAQIVQIVQIVQFRR